MQVLSRFFHSCSVTSFGHLYFLLESRFLEFLRQNFIDSVRDSFSDPLDFFKVFTFCNFIRVLIYGFDGFSEIYYFKIQTIISFLFLSLFFFNSWISACFPTSFWKTCESSLLGSDIIVLENIFLSKFILRINFMPNHKEKNLN